ncbi:probable methyltransferase-like protein 15 [Clarias gariepinus]|uniref:probable methyltransferase-like protein 15 n=1 Tax=Clarias gariepinus TaxID=13013 RepID=UPI00234C40E3|nr:probable methyltransferase-like protein 15 [Clarias gariepinus]XP_053349395.1 probable methyltransferase-like protein 15 [Clarias gariepinus]XP_053349396.1 probable methyltransferase-like protein 15 [Clarias gariepinus]XP_053349397.1 probable methyltransferase-like protein 15 [Clarias gariepinus]
MTLFCHGLPLPLRLACRRKWRVHKCEYSRRWWKPNQPQLGFCSGSSPLSPDCHRRSTKQSSLQPNQEEPHTPVLLKEVLQYMDIKPGQVVLDMTFGGGGHSKAILRSVPDVTLVAVDRDPVAFRFAQQLAEEYPGQVKPVLGRFSELKELFNKLGLGNRSVDAALLDAGCSSMQMDMAERGFSLSKDGPLDMRMDGDRYPGMPCAADAVSALDHRALACVLAAYGEEQHAKKIAAAIVQARSLYPISRTQQLASIVAGAFPAGALYARRDRLQRPSHVATKTFQALRIFVNDELNELVAGLQAAQDVLRPGGRLCVLTFHSLEDRITKRFLRGEDLSAPPHRSVRQRARAHLRRKLEEEEDCDAEDDEDEGGGGRESVHWVRLQRKVVLPSKEEVEGNPRGRSAKLRAAVRR